MNEIKAQDLRNLFTNICFEIPVYQRPYAWEEDQCSKLWDDLVEAFEDREGKQYFLGSIVVYNSENKTAYSGNKMNVVVDGQQRLTSLLLLMKALTSFSNDGALALNRLMFVLDNDDKPVENAYRLVSYVIPNKNKPSNKEQLIEVLNASASTVDDWRNSKEANRFQKNCGVFYGKIKDWANGNNIKAFVDFLLFKVYMSYINTGDSQEDALRIFSTLNDRGMPLTDSDIIKANIYAKISDEMKKDEFVTYWDGLEHTALIAYLRDYSILFQSNSVRSIKPIREFFKDEIKGNKKENKKPKNIDEILENIKKFEYLNDYTEKNSDLYYWFNVIDCWPVDLVRFPYISYMFKNISGQNGQYCFTGTKEEAIEMIWNSLRFACPVGVISKRRDNAEKMLIGACYNIIEGKPVDWPDLQTYRNGMFNEEKFRESLKFPSGYVKGILALYHLLNPKNRQGNEQGLKFWFPKYELEHILPKRDQHYDKWPASKEERDKYRYSLGNLALLNKKQNIHARNEYFEKKKESYKNSDNKDVSDPEKGLVSLTEWTPEACEKRFEEICTRLSNFIYRATFPQI